MKQHTAERKNLLNSRRKIGLTYRECFGYSNPEEGTMVKIEYQEGIKYYILWIDCPDKENIIEGWFRSRKEAEEYVKRYGLIQQTS